MRRRALVCVPVAAMLLVLPGLVVAQDAPSLDDAAVSLIAASLVATREAESMHITVTATGTLPGGPDGAATLDDATLDADVDIADQALAVVASAPSWDLNVEVRVVDDSAYLFSETMTELGGEGGPWIKTGAEALVDAIGSMIPGGPRVVDGKNDLERVETVIRKRLGRASASATVIGEEACAAGTCTRVRIAAPLEADASDLFGLFGRLGPPASPGPAATSEPVEPTMTVDVLIDTATTRLDSVVMAQGSDQGRLSITVAIGAYDAPLAIGAPPSDQVDDWSVD